MYQVFCLKDTPPTTAEEQEKCFRSKTACWRLSQEAKKQPRRTREEASTSSSR